MAAEDSSIDPRTLVPRVRQKRLDLGLTQGELAARAGLTLKTVQRVEGGGGAARDTVWRLELALGVGLGGAADRPYDPHAPSIGPKLRELRRSRGLTLEQLGSYLGTSAATLSRLEREIPGPADEAHPLLGIRLAWAFRLRSEQDLLDYCFSADASSWRIAEDQRSALRFDPRPITPEGGA